MSTLEYSQEKLLQILQRFPSVKKYYVAFSGGMDSHVLLHSIFAIKDDLKCDIIAIHINHDLNDNAQSWADHCLAICNELGIELITRKIASKCPNGESIEAWARKERYQLFHEIVTGKDMLLTAQHKNDQAETLLLQMFRGAGVKGLSSMPALKKFNHAYHARPLLAYARKNLLDYAQTYNLKWIEDESNLNLAHDRNFIRHKLTPVIQEKWPNMAETLSRTAGHLAETNQLLDELAIIDHAACCEDEPNQLNVVKLMQLSMERQKNIVRYWLNSHGAKMPSAAKLDHIINDVVASSQDAQPELKYDNVVLRRYKHILMLTNQIDVVDINDTYDWDLNKNCKLAMGELSATKVIGDGIHCAVCKDNRLEVRFRKGGETIRPKGNSQHKELKKILQEKQIFPWLRDNIPLLYVNDELVSIAGFCNEQTFSAEQDQEGWRIEWSALQEVCLG